MNWTLLTGGCSVQFLYKTQNHSKPTQTERAIWQNSDVWTLWTKIVIYRNKYPFTIGIHNENESHNDCLQSTFAHKFYNSPKPTDLTYRCWHTLCLGMTRADTEQPVLCMYLGNEHTPSDLPAKEGLPSPLRPARQWCLPSKKGPGADGLREDLE